ncbi:hypothetical protein [Roseateles puraquae]|nr:hypothetical protein [Roseateles puraquae]MDG0853053.1 hypothetical protein [Roseateles puraquae]
MFGLSALLIASSCLAQTAVRTSFDVDYVPNARPGYGYNLITGTVVPSVCLENARSTRTKEDRAIASQARYYLVEDTNSLMQMLSGSLSASYNGLAATANASASYSQEFSFDGKRSYVLAEKRVTFYYDSVQINTPDDGVLTGSEVRLSRKAIKTLREKGLQSFRQMCGDGYIVSMEAGGRQVGKINYNWTSQSEKKAFDASISGGGALATGSLSISEKTLAASTAEAVDINSREIGADVQQRPAVSVAEFIKRFQDYGGTPNFKPYYYAMTVQSYANLADWPAEREFDIRATAAKIEELSGFLNRLRDLQSKHLRAISESGKYYNIYYADWNEFYRVNDQMALRVSSIGTLIRDCVTNFSGCNSKNISPAQIGSKIRRTASLQYGDKAYSAYIDALSPGTVPAQALRGQLDVADQVPSKKSPTLFNYLEAVDYQRVVDEYYQWASSFPLERGGIDELDAMAASMNAPDLRKDIVSGASHAALAKYKQGAVTWALNNRFEPLRAANCKVEAPNSPLCAAQRNMLEDRMQVSFLDKGIAAPPPPKPPIEPLPQPRPPRREFVRPCNPKLCQ